jgi:hydroxymethylbilane synthase
MAAGHVTLGSRRTPLALAQTELVARKLARAGFSVQVLALATDGDRSLGGSLATAKGLFTAELDRALLDGDVDLVVHSLKDLPLEQDPRLELVAVPARERANDLLVLRREGPRTLGAHPLTAFADDAVPAVEAKEALAAVPLGATIGTSSPRRQSGALALRPDLVCVGVRGSIERRLERLRRGAVDALLLAEAGVSRLLRAHAPEQDVTAGDAATWTATAGLCAFRLDLESWPTAPGQGALAVQARAGGTWARSPSIAELDHEESRRSIELERALLGALGGGCALPLGASVEADVIQVALAGRDWRLAAGAAAAPMLVRRSFPRHALDPARAAAEITGEVASSAAPARIRTLRLDGEDGGAAPSLVVTSTSAGAARLVRGLARRGAAIAGNAALTADGSVAAVELTTVRILPASWPVERIEIGDDRRRWPWVLVASPGAAAVMVDHAASEPIWLRLGWCALGEGTARSLVELGVPAGLCAGGRSSGELADFALRHLDREATLFLPQSALAAPDLETLLRDCGRDVVAWPAYTVEPRRELRWPESWSPPRAVLFTAPSSAAAWAANGLPWPAESWAMGNATQRELERLGSPEIRRTEPPSPARDLHRPAQAAGGMERAR